MKIQQTLEFELDVHVVRDDENIYIVLNEINSDGGEFFYPRVVDGSAAGFDGLDPDAEVLDVIPAATCEDMTDEQIIDAYFNSPYGVA